MNLSHADLTQLSEPQTAIIDSLHVVKHRFQALFDRLPTACYACDADGVLYHWNRTASRLFGFEPPEVLSRPLWDVFPADSPDAQEAHIHAHRESLRRIFAGESLPDEEIQTRDKYGNTLHLLCSTFPFLMPEGTILGAIRICQDITRHKELEQQALAELHRATRLQQELEKKQRELEKTNTRLAELVTTDGLTGLKNHRHFRERLEDSFAFAQRRDLPLSIILLNLDHFQRYNDTFGHPAGDEVLRAVATLLHENVCAEHLTARYGGEEFALMLTSTDSACAHATAERLREAIAERPWPLSALTISLGIATTTLHTPSPSALIEEASKALAHSKRSGRNRVTHHRQLAPALLSLLPHAR
jgi:diguanylate cyclase (GGDEF)-like protein/PAS domain S-box-containing protein